MMKPWIAASLISVLLMTSTANTTAEAADDFNTWQNTLAPLYLWGVSIDGSMNGQGLSLDFNEAVSDLNGIFTLHYEGAKGNWGVIADYSFLNLKPEGTLPPGVPVNVDFNNTIAEVAALYRFGPDNPWQLLAGVRRYELDIDINVGPGTNISETITDFMFGGRYVNQFSNKWSVVARVDLATGDSDLTTNGLLAFDYRFTKLLSGFFGYRYLKYDVDEPDFKYDMTHSGPLLALAFHW